ncbi:MAG: low molecular weight phosphotyrosine protein phosphatase [Clostridiales bacterium]|nr:low molecular weight phosphotyrosine protein phosphatase [Clostridiales bacterium]MBS5878108.1 low molecular weight phosphotyrosine protein phosphatase [Clostridiales bacterium]MDU0939425.1 low molecular weight protein-tyrosine-phosphatase [Clostridiales bacterium]MDU1042409.1 low molecular weight protein-tyrosine-phosphatase [Clostridiales bacterium]MDU3490596.1 low molecular weight protein-tyrosine-phosphatase [Clostridiales bacterium]
MLKILFICHGNICRSPMAEFAMKDLVKKRGIKEKFHIESAATSTEELGNGVYPPVKALLKSKGIDCDGKTARQIRKEDYDKFDLLIGMDSANIRNMKRVFGNDRKISMLLDYTGHPGEVADPWYTRDFNATWEYVIRGCEGLLEYILRK